MAVQENAAVKVPEGVSASVAAISTDALMTSHHAVTGRARVVREDTVLLLGLGGVGFNALQVILHIGARVIVTDKRQIVLDEAEKFGVRREDIIPADTTDIGEWTRQRGLKIDKAIDFVSMPETFKAAIDSGKPIPSSALTRHLDSNTPPNSPSRRDSCFSRPSRPRIDVPHCDNYQETAERSGKLWRD